MLMEKERHGIEVLKYFRQDCEKPKMYRAEINRAEIKMASAGSIISEGRAGRVAP